MESPLPGVAMGCHRKGIFDLIVHYEFGRFLIVGTVAVLGNLLSAWGYRVLFDGAPLYFEASVALGFSVGTVVSFLLNKSFTFRAYDGKTWKQALRFVLIGMVLVAISTVVAHVIFMGCIVLPKIAGHTRRIEVMVHMLTIGVMGVFNYFALKYVAFAKAGI